MYLCMQVKYEYPCCSQVVKSHQTDPHQLHSIWPGYEYMVMRCNTAVHNTTQTVSYTYKCQQSQQYQYRQHYHDPRVVYRSPDITHNTPGPHASSTRSSPAATTRDPDNLEHIAALSANCASLQEPGKLMAKETSAVR